MSANFVDVLNIQLDDIKPLKPLPPVNTLP